MRNIRLAVSCAAREVIRDGENSAPHLKKKKKSSEGTWTSNVWKSAIILRLSSQLDKHSSPGIHGAGHASWQLLFMDSLVFAVSFIVACKWSISPSRWPDTGWAIIWGYWVTATLFPFILVSFFHRKKITDPSKCGMVFVTPVGKVWQLSLITVGFKMCCLDNQGEIQFPLELFMGSLLVQDLRQALHTLAFCIGSSKEPQYLSWIIHTQNGYIFVSIVFSILLNMLDLSTS